MNMRMLICKPFFASELKIDKQMIDRKLLNNPRLRDKVECLLKDYYYHLKEWEFRFNHHKDD